MLSLPLRSRVRLWVTFDWLANLISSSILIGSLNKHQLAAVLITACDYVQKSSNVKKIWQEFKWNIWSSFLFLTLSKLLTKPVWNLFWHLFITLSYKLLEVTSKENSHSSMLLQSCRWKWKGTSTRDFLKLSKKNLLMDVFIILQLFANDFWVRTS